MDSQEFDEIKTDEKHLEHHGVIGMKWGVHNDETKRKYGELPTGKIASALKAKTDTSVKPESSLVKRGVNALKQKREEHKQAKAEEKRKAAEAIEASKKREAEDAEIKRKYGMTREQYDALREKTLNSHDPRVVAKGMRVLTDDELKSKITRLEQEGKIKSAAAKARKEEAEARTAELNRKKQTLPYKLGEIAAKSATNAIVSSVTKNAIGPIASEVSKSLGNTGVKAITSLKQQVKAQTPKVKEEIKTNMDSVKSEATNIKSKEDKPDLGMHWGDWRASKSTQSIVESAYGETLYNRMKSSAGKAPNRENVDRDDPSRALNLNTFPKIKSSSKEEDD